MARKSDRQSDDPAHYQRFRDLATELEARDDEKVFGRAVKKLGKVTAADEADEEGRVSAPLWVIIAAVATGLSACNPPLQYVDGPYFTWVKGEQIGFKRKYKDISGLAGCIEARIPPQYTVVRGLAPHGGIWFLTLTHPGSKTVEAHYTGNYMFRDGIVEIEWSQTRRPYDDVAALRKTAEDPILGCTKAALAGRAHEQPPSLMAGGFVIRKVADEAVDNAVRRGSFRSMERPERLDSSSKRVRPLPRLRACGETVQYGAHDDARLAPEGL
jgi:hypothetical protein